MKTAAVVLRYAKRSRPAGRAKAGGGVLPPL